MDQVEDVMAKAADKKKWDALHVAYAKTAGELLEYELTLGAKYGHAFQTSWLSAAQRNKLDRLKERKSKAGEKIVDLIVRISPRGETWLRGVPSVWLREKLTWDDTIRPADEPLSVVVPGAYGYPDGYMKENKTRGHLAQESKMQIEIPNMEQWTQISGDMNPSQYGAIIARSDGNALELKEIQPVREYVGDDEAKDVGFPFWTREGYYDLDDLDPDREETKRALASMDLDLDDLSPIQRALAIAEALFRYGDKVEEGPSGWAADVITEPVKWWTGSVAGSEYIADEDDEFRREILGEEDEEEEDEEDEEEEDEDEYAEPTAEDVLDAFKDYFKHEGLDASEESARIARLMSSAAGNANRADKALDEINEIIGGHGIEPINGDHHVSNYYGDIVALYVNTGDTYNATVIYETEEGRFHVTTMGDWVEQFQETYNIR